MAKADPDIFATALPHDTSYWARHPDVDYVEVDLPHERECVARVTLRIWLKRFPHAEVVGLPPQRVFPHDWPPRPPDIDAAGDGDLHPNFWERCPDIEHAVLVEDDADGWWGVRLWLELWPG